jgi:hypothetical protein
MNNLLLYHENVSETYTLPAGKSEDTDTDNCITVFNVTGAGGMCIQAHKSTCHVWKNDRPVPLFYNMTAEPMQAVHGCYNAVTTFTKKLSIFNMLFEVVQVSNK